MDVLSAFGSYDIRGRLGTQLDASLLQAIGRAFVQVTGVACCVTGRDIRASSPSLQAALNRGLAEAGAEVIDIGLCCTEEVYFATAHFGAGGGLMVTASHNPADWNGLKLVGEEARPLAGALAAIRDLVARGTTVGSRRPGRIRRADPRAAYAARVIRVAAPGEMAPLKLLVDAGNGAAGPTFDAIAEALAARGQPLEILRHRHDPDPSFPNGIPNPLLPENRAVTAQAVRASGADLGVAWDGDGDRCFLFDEQGDFVDGEYVVGLLAGAFLARHPGAAIVHDPRVIWATRAAIATGGGRAVVSLTGHVHMKSAMRAADAVYGGEMSAHHYFRDFMSCDSGMIPWLVLAAQIGAAGRPLSALVAAARAAFPSSGEINFRIADPAAAMARVEAQWGPLALRTDRLDGLGLEFADWRLNLRRSNTEPLLRLNVETRADPELLAAKVADLRAVIAGT